MPSTSTFFSNTAGYDGEINLIDDLVREQIKLYGVDILYMPRWNVNLDRLLHESTKSVFELAMSIPMYIKSFDGYDNSMEMLTKFGVRSSDELTMVMSRSEWLAYYAPFVKAYYNGKDGHEATDILNPLEGQTAVRPKEGDLIYFPFDDSLFECKYVMFDRPFFQLGKGYIYELQLEKFEYSGETLETGITKVDQLQVRRAYYRMQFHLDEGGTNSYRLNEPVKIYNVTDLTPPEDPSQTPFALYNDAGFLNDVPVVDGRVMEFNKPKKRLIVGDLSNLNPEQQKNPIDYPIVGGDEGGTEYPDGYYDVTENAFDKSLIVGQTTGASWVSYKTTTAPEPFDDTDDLQEEFDQIKVLDVADESPFGFV